MLNRFHNLNVYFDLNNGFVKISFLILIILALAFMIDFLLSRSFIKKGYRLFVAPGIVIHELAHALMCILTGAKVSKVSLFDKEGGKVIHAPSKIPIIGGILISLAPFVAGSVLIYFLSEKLGFSQIDIQSVQLTKIGIYKFIVSELGRIDYHNIFNIMIIYLVITTAVTMTPSIQDFKNIITSLISVGFILYLVDRFTKFDFSYFVIPHQVLTLLLTVVVLLILCFILSIVVFAVSKTIKI